MGFISNIHFGGIRSVHGASILVYNAVIVCVMGELVFDEQLPEFGALVVDSNGKASTGAGADK